MTPYGFRQVKVWTDLPAETEILVDNHRGAYLYHEVANDTDSDIDFEVNYNPQGGHKGAKIPIKAGTTRAIPLALYNFRASGVVTVVSYGM